MATLQPYDHVVLNQRTVTLTDAQIKALNDTPVVIVPAPGTSRVLSPLSVWLFGHFEASYDEFMPANWENLKLSYSDTGLSVAELFNTDASTGNIVLFNTLFSQSGVGGALNHLTFLPNNVRYSTGWDGPYPAVTATNIQSYVNQPLQLQTSEALTGGTAANTLTVTVLYAIYDVSAKRFV